MSSQYLAFFLVVITSFQAFGKGNEHHKVKKSLARKASNFNIKASFVPFETKNADDKRKFYIGLEMTRKWSRQKHESMCFYFGGCEREESTPNSPQKNSKDQNSLPILSFNQSSLSFAKYKKVFGSKAHRNIFYLDFKTGQLEPLDISKKNIKFVLDHNAFAFHQPEILAIPISKEYLSRDGVFISTNQKNQTPSFQIQKWPKKDNDLPLSQDQGLFSKYYNFEKDKTSLPEMRFGKFNWRGEIQLNRLTYKITTLDDGKVLGQEFKILGNKGKRTIFESSDITSQGDCSSSDKERVTQATLINGKNGSPNFVFLKESSGYHCSRLYWLKESDLVEIPVTCKVDLWG